MAKECEYRPGLRRKIQEIDIVVLLVFLGLMIFALINFQFFNAKITATAQNSGFLIMSLIIIFIEFFPAFLSPMLPLAVNIGAGFNPWVSILIASFASTLGSLIGFEIGKQYGFQYVCVLFSPEQWVKTEKFISKYGKVFIALAAFTPLPYFPLIFGALDLDRKDFLIFGIIPRVLGIILFGYLLIHGINILN